LGCPRSQPSPLLPWSRLESPPHHTKPLQKLLCQPRAQSRHLPMKWAQKHCYWAQHLLTGLKGKDSHGPAWAGRQHCLEQASCSPHPSPLPTSLVGSTGEASTTTLAHLFWLPSPSSAASPVNSFPVPWQRPGAGQRGFPPGRGKARQSIPHHVGRVTPQPGCEVCSFA